MKSEFLLSLALLGFLSVDPGLAQRGDAETTAKNLENADQYGKAIEDLEARLNETVDELSRQKIHTEELKKENEDIKSRLEATEKDIEKLKQTAHRIAFSVSLANSSEVYRGPCSDKTLSFTRVFSNTGDGYDLNTGIFTAPVSGLYFFTFSTYGYNTHTTGAILLKNGVRQVSTYDSPTADGADSGANAAVLRLDEGDKVHLELWDDGQVFDNLNGHTTFSGFLLFPA
ncbi:cerebellin 11 [Salarias fasciatus]|uniref:cerebellin 11 n=1 Tax=Salarias fasciatus TaxID=181472 RepID=UPI0011769E64|nr:complement C1q-like protein 2 [Salarias fasciatus]